MYNYTSPVTNLTYLLNTTMVSYSTAQSTCKNSGGHLVAWFSLDEQADVELAFVTGGSLLPTFHKMYWMGFSALQWPDWKWVDPTAGRFSNAAYKHWGMDEPNNDPALQLCGAGNYTQAYGNAWGWADANCGTKLPFICKMIPFGALGGAGPGGPPAYLSKFTGNSFSLHTTPLTQPEAEAHCISQASHLATYLNVEEQVEVEAYYVQAGFLLPDFHKVYWMGLDSNVKDWPKFRWMDRAVPGPNDDTYRHWGKLLPDGVPEPNSKGYCAVANFTTSYGGAAGWCDTDCNKTRAVFMCKKQGNAGYYYNATNGNTYIFNASYATFDQAQDSCKLRGAHLVAWTSYKEQAEVEGYFVKNGYLLQTYHLYYWIGANVSDAIYWPNFTWIDPYTPGPINSTYEHWGQYQPNQETEPNFYLNQPPELCTVANYTQAYFNPAAWGWADDYCLNKHPFMCKMLREWQRCADRQACKPAHQAAACCAGATLMQSTCRCVTTLVVALTNVASLCPMQPPPWLSASRPASPTSTSSTQRLPPSMMARLPATATAATW